MSRPDATDLELAVEEMPLVDTHEHLALEREWLDERPDVLQDLFWSPYAGADLRVAGATAEAVERLLDPTAGSVGERFAGVKDAWKAMRHTGYGEAVATIAREVYGLDELSAAGIEEAQGACEALYRPGEHLRLLAEVARLDHVQIDDARWQPSPTDSRPDFFLSDLSWWRFCNGEIECEEILAETGIEIRTLDDLRTAMAAIFARFAPVSVAVKSQHAYNRTLRWEERSDEEAAQALARVLSGSVLDVETRFERRDLGGGGVEETARIVLGDWCWARGVELSIEHGLPFKIHTGYFSGTGGLHMDRIRAGNLDALLRRYPEGRFVLMHIAYPYQDELLALAKHFPNVWVDLCWAWSLDPRSTAEFVRAFVHAVPANKLFAFGGDTHWPTNVVAHAAQARRWLVRALADEVAAGDLGEGEAIVLASRFMHDNQYECFDLDATRAASRAAAAGPTGTAEVVR